MRLFYQSFGVSRGSGDGAYGQVLKRIVDSAAASGGVGNRAVVWAGLRSQPTSAI